MERQNQRKAKREDEGREDQRMKIVKCKRWEKREEKEEVRKRSKKKRMIKDKNGKKGRGGERRAN